MYFELMFLFSKSSNYIRSSVLILKVLMVTHVLHFLARRLDKEEQFFKIFYVHVSAESVRTQN